ncbi:MAG: hypothetical protein ABI651_05865, partial [Verrucomicrobiota bacterium]
MLSVLPGFKSGNPFLLEGNVGFVSDRRHLAYNHFYECYFWSIAAWTWKMSSRLARLIAILPVVRHACIAKDELDQIG